MKRLVTGNSRNLIKSLMLRGRLGSAIFCNKRFKTLRVRVPNDCLKSLDPRRPDVFVLTNDWLLDKPLRGLGPIDSTKLLKLCAAVQRVLMNSLLQNKPVLESIFEKAGEWPAPDRSITYKIIESD